MNNIFILDGQTDEVLGHINKKYVIDNEHEKDLPTHKDYFRFTVLADNRHAEHLTKRNGLIIPGEDGELLEFRIFESIKYRNNEGLFIEVHALATYLDLKNQKIFDPHKTNPETAVQHANLALAGTEWQVGQVDFKGIRTLTFDNPFNSYDYILRISREFELEPSFYIETDGNKVTGRYVDLVERVGEFRGRTIEFGRDLQSIERKEDTSEVVTALWVYGPQRDDGTRLKVFVEDDEARQRWGRRGQHIIDYYEPQTENQDITEERLETLGNMELKKRINAVVTYEANIVDLENVPGMENKKIRFGDTIRIKDTKFNPPLYLEARVFNFKRDVFNKAKKTVQLGDFVEYTEEEVQAIWKLLQRQIQQKISAVQAEKMIEEYAEPKKVESPTPPPIEEGENPIWVDTSKEPNVAHVADFNNNKWVKITPTEAEEVNAPSRDETIIEGENYNGLKWSANEGLIVERSDGKVRSILNGTEGIKVQQKVNDDWVDVFYVDQNGNANFAGALEAASGTFSGRVEGAVIEGSEFISNDEDGGGIIRISDGVIETATTFDFTHGAVLERDQLRIHATNAVGKTEFSSTLTNNSLRIQQSFNASAATYSATGVYSKNENGVLTLHTDQAGNFNGNVSVNADGGNLFLGLNTTNNLIIAPNNINLAGGPSIDTAGSSARWKQSDNNYIIQNTLGNIFFYINGAQRHAFFGDGTKTGGSFEFEDGIILGMSPIDSPQTLIEYVEFDIPLTKNGTKVYLDERYRQAVHNFAVFPNNGEIVEKGYDYFIIAGEGLADIRIVGERLGEEGTFWVDMRGEEDGETEFETTATY